VEEIEAFFSAVREAADAQTWSRGVELARANAVNGESLQAGEVVLRVSTRGGLICPAVRLHILDEDWECECNGPKDPCEHVTAATIALRLARKQGKELPSVTDDAVRGSGQIQYRLARTQTGGLALTRYIVRGDEAFLLQSSLHALSSGRVDGPKFLATPADLAVERALGPQVAGGALAPGVLRSIFPHLGRCAEVFLDGELISISSDPVGPRAVVEDYGNGFRLFIEEDPSIVERFQGGVVRCHQTLCFANRGRLTGRELSELPQGRIFSPDQAPELVAQILPELERRIPVEIRTRRLPRTRIEQPRIDVVVEREGDNLSVLPLLVYGNPATARIDADKLVPLGSGELPIRNERLEEKLRVDLRESLGLVPGHRICFPPEEAVRFSARLRAWRSGSISGKAHQAFFLAPGLVPRIESSGEDVKVLFESHASETDRTQRADPGAVVRAWQSGEALVALEGGGWAPLPSDWLSQFGATLADLLAAKESSSGKLPTSALADAARLCDAHGLARPRGADALMALAENFRGIPESPLPSDLCATLRPYQREGVNWLAFLRDAKLGALLADDMGLGKTLQTLCILRGPSLVVAPTSVLHGWSDEIRRFRPRQRVCTYHGPGRSLDPDATITLTTYAILRLDIELLAQREWDVVVLDEAQNIKNPESQAAQAACRLQAGFRVALTNHLVELWSQFHFTNPGFFGTQSDFEARYARPMARGDEEAAAHLRRRIRPFLLRRLKRDVAPELPPRSDMVLYCSLEQEERELYDALCLATRQEVIERIQRGGSVFEALELLLRLRQAACHAALVPGAKPALAEKPSAKLQLLLEKLQILFEDGHKALVFSQWTSLLDLIEPQLKAASLPFLRLDGSTRDRSAVVHAFQDPHGPPIMLISLKAGGTGLNLTAADHVFLVDPWWNPAVEDQAADRTHRIGQEKPVLVYRLVAEGTVEEAILGLQERKRAIRDAALGDGMQASQALSREDLLSLLA